MKRRSRPQPPATARERRLLGPAAAAARRSSQRELVPAPAADRLLEAGADGVSPVADVGPAVAVQPPGRGAYDPALMARSHAHWTDGRWGEVLAQEPRDLADHPDRARWSSLAAGAALQVGDRHGAWAHARRALYWGADRRQLAQAMLCAAHETLARASLFAGRADATTDAHLVAAFAMTSLSAEARRRAAERRQALEGHLRAAVSDTLKRRHPDAAAVAATGWLTVLAERCLTAADVHEAVDAALRDQVPDGPERVRFLMLVAQGFLGRRDRLTAQHFLGLAARSVGSAGPQLRRELADRLAAAGRPEAAVDLLVSQAVADSWGEGSSAPAAAAALKAYDRMRQVSQAASEHGHDLLMAWLEQAAANARRAAAPRTPVVIEIGSTREEVAGQGSTRKLAECCQRLGLHFVSVDMDPHNTRMAAAVFGELGVPFQAVTAKGEDYLRDQPGPFDFVFLDAYDFDHGQHSELRQSRYERYLGARIDDGACHRMHLDCARSLVDKLAPHGAVCLDDTWLDQGRWTAKGTLAMPFLLSSGFELVEARNRAALLVRSLSSAAAPTPAP